MAFLVLLLVGVLGGFGWRVYQWRLEGKTWWKQAKIKEVETSFDSDH